MAFGTIKEKGIKKMRKKLKVVEEEGLKSLLGEYTPFVNGHEVGCASNALALK